MTDVGIPPLIHEVLAQPCNRLVADAVAAGCAVLGTTCSLLPEPLLSLDGLVPIRIRPLPAAGTPMADTYLSSLVCPYPRNVLEAAFEGSLNFVDGWIFTCCCDHVRRLHDNLVYLLEPPFTRMVDLPNKTTDASVEWLTVELTDLAAELTERFGVDPSDAALAASVRRVNRGLGVLRSIGDLRKRDVPPLSGADFQRLVLACQLAPRAALVPCLTELAERLVDQDDGPAPRARLMVVGSQLMDPGFLDLIESVGARVVADRSCTGSMPGLSPFPEEAGDRMLERFARHVLETARCPRMMDDFDRRSREIRHAVEDLRVDGVVLQALKFCDLWGVEAGLLARELRDLGIPVLRLEREYATTGEGQVRTRVQAFLESMGR